MSIPENVANDSLVSSDQMSTHGQIEGQSTWIDFAGTDQNLFKKHNEFNEDNTETKQENTQQNNVHKQDQVMCGQITNENDLNMNSLVTSSSYQQVEMIQQFKQTTYQEGDEQKYNDLIAKSLHYIAQSELQDKQFQLDVHNTINKDVLKIITDVNQVPNQLLVKTSVEQNTKTREEIDKLGEKYNIQHNSTNIADQETITINQLIQQENDKIKNNNKVNYKTEQKQNALFNNNHTKQINENSNNHQQQINQQNELLQMNQNTNNRVNFNNQQYNSEQSYQQQHSSQYANQMQNTEQQYQLQQNINQFYNQQQQIAHQQSQQVSNQKHTQQIDNISQQIQFQQQKQNTKQFQQNEFNQQYSQQELTQQELVVNQQKQQKICNNNEIYTFINQKQSNESQCDETYGPQSISEKEKLNVIMNQELIQQKKEQLMKENQVWQKKTEITVKKEQKKYEKLTDQLKLFNSDSDYLMKGSFSNQHVQLDLSQLQKQEAERKARETAASLITEFQQQSQMQQTKQVKYSHFNDEIQEKLVLSQNQEYLQQHEQASTCKFYLSNNNLKIQSSLHTYTATMEEDNFLFNNSQLYIKCVSRGKRYILCLDDKNAKLYSKLIKMI